MEDTTAKGATYATHEVRNQARELAGYNAFTGDVALQDAVKLYRAAWAKDELKACGALAGSAQVQSLARLVDRNRPELRSHDRFGNRVDEIEFHPAWHELMGRLRGSSYHSLSWTTARSGAHVARAAISYLWNQAENGVCCPGAMTFASIAALKTDANLLARFQEKILSPEYDSRPVAPAQKKALGVGMAMTEKQGGSDLRQIETTATPAAMRSGPGASYLLTGHKWFFSAPTSDLFLTLARTGKGVSCFLAQGWLDDGSRNRLLIQRLKDKCGNRSNASAEVEFRNLRAVMLGEEGRGIPTILEMGHLTRLECAISSAGIIRQATVQAINHAQTRRVFDRYLADQPIMSNVLADLAIESESAYVAGDARRLRARQSAGKIPQPHHHPGRQILDLQTRADSGGGSPGMPRRQRLHRRTFDGTALPRGPAERLMGRHVQHHLPRCHPRARTRTRNRRRRAR